MKITVRLWKTLLIFETLLRSDQCLVFQTELLFDMWSTTPPDTQTSQQPFYVMSINMKEFMPYFCKVSELDQTKFSLASRREIVQNIKCEVKMKSWVGEVENTVPHESLMLSKDI